MTQVQSRVWSCHNKLGIVHCTYLGVMGYNFPKILYSLKIFFTFTNLVGPNEMQYYAAFHLGLHCLQKKGFVDCPSKFSDIHPC